MSWTRLDDGDAKVEDFVVDIRYWVKLNKNLLKIVFLAVMLSSREATEKESADTGLFHRVYLPKHSAGEKLPTVVLVHGRGGDAGIMWLFTKTLEGVKPLVVSPQAPLDDPHGGYKWWEINQVPNALSDSPSSTKLSDLESPLEKLSGFINALPSCYPVDTSRLYAIGFSQGSAMLATLSLRKPQLFNSIALLSGFLPGVVHKEVAGTKINSLPKYFIAHGTEDGIIPFTRAEQMRDSLVSCGADVEFHAADVSHKTGSEQLKALRVWFEKQIS